MWSQREEKDFWLHWLRVYRDSKCLWDTETKRKASRNERQEAYNKLADLAKVVNPSADINFVRGRINAFRTCYRREFKKLEAARQNGVDYKPQLFYFDTMKFTNIGDYPEDSIFDGENKMDDDCDDPIGWSEKKSDSTMYSNKEDIKTRTSDISKDNYTSPIEKRKKPIFESPTEQESEIGFEKLDENFECVINKAAPVSYNAPASSEDEYGIFGKRIAAHFRNMPANQRLIAEKIISDVCIFARMGKLTLESGLNISQTTAIQPRQFQQKTEDDNVDYDDPDTYIYTT